MKFIWFLTMKLICVTISTNVMAWSCSESSFKRAERIIEKYEKAVNKAIDFYNDECVSRFYDYEDKATRDQKLQTLNDKYDSVLSEAASLGGLYEKMDKNNHHEFWYKIHSSCARAGDSENSERAFENYEMKLEFFNDHIMNPNKNVRGALNNCLSDIEDEIDGL